MKRRGFLKAMGCAVAIAVAPIAFNQAVLRHIGRTEVYLDGKLHHVFDEAIEPNLLLAEKTFSVLPRDGCHHGVVVVSLDNDATAQCHYIAPVNTWELTGGAAAWHNKRQATGKKDIQKRNNG